MSFRVIPGAFGEDPVAHAEAIKFLEDALERAKREKATFAMVVMMLPNNSVMDGYSSRAKIRPFTILGALFDIMMKFRNNEIEQ